MSLNAPWKLQAELHGCSLLPINSLPQLDIDEGKYLLAPLVDKIIVVFVPIVECKSQVAITNSIGINSADASSDIVESDSHFVRCLINDFQVSPDSYAKFVITPFAPGRQE